MSENGSGGAVPNVEFSFTHTGKFRPLTSCAAQSVGVIGGR